MRHGLAGLIGLLTLLYPVAVYFGIQFFEPWVIALLLFVLLLLRLVILPVKAQWNLWLIMAGMGFCVLAIWNNNLITLRFYPVMINLGLFIIFLTSLLSSQPIVERLARLKHPQLPEQGVRYTRKVTIIWSIFFMINGLIAMVTALWCSFECWSLYNGLIAYILIGLLMGIEYLIRLRTQAHVH